ncbi:CoA transferase [Rhodobacterales bacterium 52_120_T64]|nr:CoA transferase [Rhodobacterales bacterium 52_120_T64]
MTQPLDDVLVLDFSTLLPGPMATLMLAEAGAEVIKLERPVTGEDMRLTFPQIEGRSLGYAVLNRGKKSLALDLKAEGAVESLLPLIKKADVIVEQFRPGVMERLGLGFEAVKALNPGVIYCSITGYGQTGPKRSAAGHDMNYVGDAGILSLSSGPVEQPVNPFALVADIGGGTYPAVVNILLALRHRDKTGQGAHLDIAMAEGAFAFAYWAHAKGVVAKEPIENGGDRLTGGTARYRMYPAADGRQVIVGAIEEKFWQAFCNVIELPESLRDDDNDQSSTMAEVERRIAAQSSDHWEPLLVAADCCCSIVKTPLEAAQDPHFNARGVFDWTLSVGETQIEALPLPIAPMFRAAPSKQAAAPDLGEHNVALGLDKSAK